MLEKVFNMFVDIPKNVAVNIPGLRDPSSLPHLKRVRQKIKKKIKIAEEQLKYQQEISKTTENSSIENNNLTVSNNISNQTNSHMLAEKLCNSNKNNFKSSQSDCNEKYHNNLFENNTRINENEINKSNRINLQSSNLFPSIAQTKLKKLTCTVTSSNTNSKEINEISYHNKPSINLNDFDQKCSSTQVINNCKFYEYNVIDT